MKKFTAFTLAFLLIFSSFAFTGLAAPKFGGNQQNINNNINININVQGNATFDNVKFVDIGDVKWAQKSIEKMQSKGIIKGFDDKTFKPRNNVTELQVIALALRIMGKESEVQAVNDVIPKNYKGKKPEKWGEKYLIMAIKMGILDAYDLAHFNPNQPAKRYEVAKYLLRAMGYKDEAEKFMNVKLPYSDAAAVPKSAVGYVYLADKMGLMKGYPDNTFRPNAPVTRAEMAVIMDRVDELIDNDVDRSEIEGIVKEVDPTNLTLKVATVEGTFDFQALKETSVYKEADGTNQTATFSDISIGDRVRLVLNEQNQVVFILIKGVYKKYEGTVKEVNPVHIAMVGAYPTITLTVYGDSGNQDITFKVPNTGQIYLDGKRVQLSAIKPGYKAIISAYNDKAVEIRAQSTENVVVLDKYEGTIESINTDNMTLTVTLEDNEGSKTFKLSESTLVYKDDEVVTLDKLTAGTKAEIWADENLNVNKIKIED